MDHAVLQFEGIVAPAIVAVAPDMLRGCSVDNANDEAQPRARVDNPARQEIAADLHIITESERTEHKAAAIPSATLAANDRSVDSSADDWHGRTAIDGLSREGCAN